MDSLRTAPGTFTFTFAFALVSAGIVRAGSHPGRRRSTRARCLAAGATSTTAAPASTTTAATRAIVAGLTDAYRAAILQSIRTVDDDRIALF
jgi:hypothetical protein